MSTIDTRPIWQSTYTAKGLQLLAKLHAGTTLTITRVVPGAGYVPPESLALQTAVTDPRGAFLLFEVKPRPDGVARLPVQLSNQNVTQGYNLWQVGVYAKDPNDGEILYCMMQSDRPDYIPTPAQMPGFMVNFGIHLIFGNADHLSVTIDPEGMLSNAMMQEHIVNPTTHTPAFAAHNALNSAHNAAFSVHNTAKNAHPDIWVDLASLRSSLAKMTPFFEFVRIDHGLGTHPQSLLGVLQYGAGMGGAGEYPAGGTDAHSIPVSTIYHDSQTLTVKTIGSIVDLGMPELHKMNKYEYTITFQGNNKDSLFIRLI